ncbi:MAG: XRE family transcriptional regulator [Bacteroidetes bacterium]|nr:MAG: XRE family transcriptional regulator [Bacteroidota bacterium]
MKTIDDRIRDLIKHVSLTSQQLAQSTGIKYVRWTTIRCGKAKVRAEEVEALCKLYPHFQMWVATGQVMPNERQVCPDHEK